MYPSRRKGHTGGKTTLLAVRAGQELIHVEHRGLRFLSFEPRLYLFSPLPDCIDVFHDRAGQFDSFFVADHGRYGYLVRSKGIVPLVTGPYQHGIFVVIVMPTKLSIEIGQHLGDVFVESDTGPQAVGPWATFRRGHRHLIVPDQSFWHRLLPVSYTHLRAHETDSYLVCRLLLEKK